MIVTSVPTYGENTVADHTFALLLALSRRLLFAEQRGRLVAHERRGDLARRPPRALDF